MMTIRSLKLMFLCFLNMTIISCGIAQQSNRDLLYSDRQIDKRPAFTGGKVAMDTFIKENLKWPSDYGNSGYVIIKATVSKTGEILNPTIEKKLCDFCDKEALRIVTKMPKWQPGQKNDEPVNAIVNIPIRFELNH